MVSLGNNQQSSGGGYFFNPDANQIFDETDEASLVSSVLVSDDEPHFKTIPLTGVIVIEIICTILLLASTFLVPLYIDKDSCFIICCIHVAYWWLLFISTSFRNYHHNRIQRYGYLEFFRRTQVLLKLILLVPSIGNAFLILGLFLFQKFCLNFEDCSTDGYFKCYNYLSIFIGSEVPILLFCLIKYLNFEVTWPIHSKVIRNTLVLVIKFNKSKAVPDVHQDDLLISYVQSYAPVNEVGFRDEDYMEEVLEKQADMIRYLKQHSNNLSRKIMKLNSQLEALQSSTVRF